MRPNVCASLQEWGLAYVRLSSLAAVPIVVGVKPVRVRAGHADGARVLGAISGSARAIVVRGGRKTRAVARRTRSAPASTSFTARHGRGFRSGLRHDKGHGPVLTHSSARCRVLAQHSSWSLGGALLLDPRLQVAVSELTSCDRNSEPLHARHSDQDWPTVSWARRIRGRGSRGRRRCGRWGWRGRLGAPRARRTDDHEHA